MILKEEQLLFKVAAEVFKIDFQSSNVIWRTETLSHLCVSYRNYFESVSSNNVDCLLAIFISLKQFKFGSLSSWKNFLSLGSDGLSETSYKSYWRHVWSHFETHKFFMQIKIGFQRKFYQKDLRSFPVSIICIDFWRILSSIKWN